MINAESSLLVLQGDSMATILKAGLLIICFFCNAYARASIIVLDFEGAGNNAELLSFYNGGADSQGLAGVDYGIQFGSDALSLRDKDIGGSGNFANEPSPDTVMFFTSGSAVLNYALGFDTGFSFFYSAKYAATVYVYDALNASGNLLASIKVLPQYADNCSGDPTGTYCNWTPVGAGFEGIAKSVDFGGTVQHTGYDNVTFGSATPGGSEIKSEQRLIQAAAIPLPEPATWALFVVGLMGLSTLQRCKTDDACQYRNAFI